MSARHRYLAAGKQIVVIKHDTDTRYTDLGLMTTHDHAYVPGEVGRYLYDIAVDFDRIDVIIIDEIQFFDDKIDFCMDMAGQGKIIVCAGLNCNYLRKPFSDMGEFYGICTKIISLTAICEHCKSEDAIWSKRIVDDDTEELIGGRESYVPVCRECYDLPSRMFTIDT
jgi:thymidine kinase